MRPLLSLLLLSLLILFYLYYAGDLKKSIAGMGFDDDTNEMTEETLFDRHYKTLKKLHHDSLIILDNFNVLPKDDSFFREFAQNDFQLLITTRCRPTQYPIMELKSLSASGMEVEELLYELQTCGLSISSGEAVELYKDGDYTDGLMAEHLKKLLQLGKLSDPCLDVHTRGLSAVPARYVPIS
jgi:hypothetical protein